MMASCINNFAVQRMIEDESVVLRKHCKALLLERKRIREDAGGKLREQERTVQRLREEQHRLRLELTRLQGDPCDVESKLHRDKLLDAEKERRVLFSRLNHEQGRCADLSRTQEYLRSRISDLRSISSSLSKSAKIKSYSKLLESRQERFVRLLDELSFQNSALRERVDVARKDECVLSGIEQKAVEELNSVNYSISQISESIRSLYAARERLAADMALLKRKAEEEYAIYDTEWLDLNEAIERLDKGGNDNEAFPAIERRNPPNLPPPIENTCDPQGEPLISAYEAIFDQIFKGLNQHMSYGSISELCNVFSSRDATNYSLWNRLSAMEHEFERMDSKRAFFSLSLKPGGEKLLLPKDYPTISCTSLENTLELEDLLKRVQLMVQKMLIHLTPNEGGMDSVECLPTAIALIDARLEGLLDQTVDREATEEPTVSCLTIPDIPSSLIVEDDEPIESPRLRLEIECSKPADRSRSSATTRSSSSVFVG